MRTAGLVLFLATLAGHAHAGTASQEPGATLRVRVVASPAPAGAPAPASVVVSREGGPARRWTSAVSAPSALASFTGLPEGTYRVTVERPGAAAATGDVRVGARGIVTVRATLVPSGSAGSRIDLLDLARVGEGLDFDERWLQDLPAGGNVWTLVETAVPFVIADRMDNGGLGTGRSAIVGSRGASWATTSVTFGDVKALEPNRVGLIPFAPDASAATAISVTSGIAPIEADTPGVIIALTPRRPGARRHGALQASFTDPRMVAVNQYPDAPAIARLASWRELGLQLSGPLTGRTGLFVSGVVSRAQQHERDLPGLWTSEAQSLFTHLVANPTDRDQVRVVSAAQHVAYPFEERRQFLNRNVTEQATFLQSQVTWDRVNAGGSRVMVSTGAQRGSFTPDVTSQEGGTVDRVTAGVVPRPAASTVSSQWEVKGLFAPAALTWGGTTHEWRAGLHLRRAGLTTEVLALPDVAEQVAGLAARVWRPLAPAAASSRTLTHASAYVADRMALGSHLTLDAGVRADLTSGSAAGAATGIAWRTVSPRLALQWSHGPLGLFGGAGLYADPLTLSLLSHGDPGETVSNVHRWHDLDGNRRFDAGELGVLVSRAGRGPSVASIDPDLRAPRTFERTVGLELRYRRLVTMRGALIWRDQTSLVGSVNTGVPASSYRVVYIPDAFEDWDGPDDDQPLAVYDRLPGSFGQDAFLLTNPADGDASYRGIEVTWGLTTRRVVMVFGATAYKTRGWAGDLGFGPLENDQNAIGTRFEQPNATPVLQGSFFFDRSYVGKWSGSYRAPWDIRMGWSARYQDGQPFTRLVIAPDLAGGPEMIHAYRTGRTRYTYTLTLDVRIEKGISIAGRRAAVHLDVFNATRHQNEVEEDAVTGPRFRRSTAIQPPLALRLGFRIGL